MRHEFLSPGWVDEAERIYAQHRHHAEGRALPPVRVNLVVSGAPFADPEVKAHTDTRSGDLVIGLGHAADADLTVTLDYATAKALLVEQDPQASIEALLLGKIRIEGDLARLAEQANLDLAELPALLTSLNLGGIANLSDLDPVAAEIGDQLRSMTA